MEEIDLKEVISIVWKKKIFIIITTILFCLISLIFFTNKYNVMQNIKNRKNSEKMYYAETRFIVGTAQTSTTTYDETVLDTASPINVTSKTRVIQTDTLIETYNELIKSKTSLNNTIKELNLDINVNNLSHLISFSRVSESDLLSLTVAYKDENKVIQIANKLLDEFIKNMSNAYSTDQVAIIDKAYLLSDAEVASSSAISQIATANSIAKNSINHTIKNTTICTLLGLILSIGIVLVLEIFNDTIKNEEDLNKLTNSNTLAILNKNKLNNDYDFTILKIKLEEIKSFLITSINANVDTSYIANNLATSLANSQKKILLLDLNFNESNIVGKGLIDYINSDNKDINKFISKSAVNNLDVLLVGSNNTTKLEEFQLKTILNSLENTYDNIIINSANILDTENTVIASKVIKNSILVTAERNTTITQINNTKTLINDINGNIVGYILIK